MDKKPSCLITEIGAVLVDVRANQNLETFQQSVRPNHFAMSLKYHDMPLTVTNGPNIEGAIDTLDDWIDQLECRYAFTMLENAYEYRDSDTVAICTWTGIYLNDILPAEAKRKDFEYPNYLHHWIDMHDVVKVRVEHFCIDAKMIFLGIQQSYRTDRRCLQKNVVAKEMEYGDAYIDGKALRGAHAVATITRRLWGDNIRNYVVRSLNPKHTSLNVLSICNENNTEFGISKYIYFSSLIGYIILRIFLHCQQDCIWPILALSIFFCLHYWSAKVMMI